MPLGSRRAILPGGPGYYRKVLGTRPGSLIGYWPLWEQTGAAAQELSGVAGTGAYVGVELGRGGMGDGRTAPYFDGTSDYVNVYTAGLASAFSGAEGTMLVWAKAATTVWTDSTTRRIFLLRADVNNRVIVDKNWGALDTPNDQLVCTYISGGASCQQKTGLQRSGWFSIGITWSFSAGQVRAYVDGVQQGATMTGLGVWVGALTATTCVIGAIDTTPTGPWHGWVAHGALWNAPLNPGEMAALARL